MNRRESLARNIGTTAKVATAITSGVKAGKAAYDWWTKNRAYTVSVMEGDPAYYDVHAWLLTLVPGERKRALLAVSRTERIDEPMPADALVRDAELSLCFDDGRPQVIHIDGHLVRVAVHKPGSPKDDVQPRRADRDVIQFTASTEAGQQAIVRHLERIVAARAKDRRPTLRIVDRWGNWIRREDLPLRTLDSVVLRAGQKERIAADLQRFLDAEAEYARRAIPYHRGYLFDGPPGTGKTSLARALADHFRMDLWYLPLGELDKDAKLLDMLTRVNSRSVVLLEDVDVYQAAQMRDGTADSETGLSLAGLLNALDGAATPHGLVSILTTNRADVLDPALVRAGRIDMAEHINPPDSDQAGRLFEVFYGRPPFAATNRRQVWPTETQPSSTEESAS